MAPVKKVPNGTITLPPPCLLQASMAFLNASVFNVLPSPTAPYFVIKNCLAAKRGALISFRNASISFNGWEEFVHFLGVSCPLAIENEKSKIAKMYLLIVLFLLSR